jgi:hypothetical protein
MRVLTKDAYTRAAESSPNRNGDGDVAVRAEMDALDSGVSSDGGAAGFPVGMLPSVKLVLPKPSTRRSRLVPGWGVPDRGTPSPSAR